MSRIALDGITLAFGEWPGLREADTHKHAMEGVANLQRVKSAPQAFLAGG